MNVPPKINPKSVAWGIAIAFASSSVAGQANVSTSVIGQDIAKVTGTALHIGDLAGSAYSGGYEFDLFLDSDADILLFDATLSTEAGSVFNDPRPGVFGDHHPPLAALANWFGPFYDTWVTTPGGTSAANGASLVAEERVTHFDTTDEGPQSGFHWASIILVPDEHGVGSATLNATIQTAATPVPLLNEVTVELTIVPEPTSFCLIATALFGMIRTARRKRAINRTRR